MRWGNPTLRSRRRPREHFRPRNAPGSTITAHPSRSARHRVAAAVVRLSAAATAPQAVRAMIVVQRPPRTGRPQRGQQGRRSVRYSPMQRRQVAQGWPSAYRSASAVDAISVSAGFVPHVSIHGGMETIGLDTFSGFTKPSVFTARLRSPVTGNRWLSPPKPKGLWLRPP